MRKTTFLFSLLCFFCLPAIAQEAPLCADFLAQIGKKPAPLEFIGCAPTQHHQLRALEASYRVRGKDAEKIERYFVNNSGMPKLRRQCCIWESVPTERGAQHSGRLTDKKGRHYTVTMFSEETTSAPSSRSAWVKIPYFYIAILHALEEP